MLLGKVKLGLAAMSALALIGCAHPDLIDPGASEVTVVNELGAPDSRMEFKDGSSILVYSMQPFGKEVYWMRFNEDGKYVGKERTMNEEHFKLVIPGKHTRQDVYNMFGHCAQEYEVTVLKSMSSDSRIRPLTCIALTMMSVWPWLFGCNLTRKAWLQKRL